MADQLYVCENCGRCAPLPFGFDDDCRPGWTHGKLIKVQGFRAEFAGRELHTILLDDYEVANLRALLNACGYPAGGEGIRSAFGWCLQTGDWLGQIYNKLPAVDQPPNTSPEEQVDRVVNALR